MKTRIISAVVALGLVIPLLIIRGVPMAIGIGILALLAYNEVLDLKESHNKIPSIVKVLGMVALLLIVYTNFSAQAFGITYESIAASILMIFIPTLFYKDKYLTKDAIFLLGSVIFLGTFFNALIFLIEYNIWILVFLLLIPIMTDTFAYLVGSLIGKHKVTEISPNKSIEGYVGGTLVGSAIAVIFYLNVIDGNIGLLKLILMVLGLSIVGQLGDLFFSKIKRENNLKDFSKIMPGHGGILDRLDSLIFVVLAYIILFMVL